LIAAASSPSLSPFAPGVFRGFGHEARLIGGRCERCGAHAFPYQERCIEDGAEMTRVDLPNEGVLYSFSIVRTKAPFGLPEPYPVGYVDLPDVDLRVFMLLDPACGEEFEIGASLTLQSAPLGVDLTDAPCLRPFFTLNRNKG
jgi:uncharacterized OB-fold protein